eukprot:5578271-Ditylum_brightwellii.AAC.1
MAMSPYRINQYYNTPDSKLLLATNGSASEKGNDMTFKWVIIKENKEFIADHSDPAYGKTVLFCPKDY